MLPPLIRTLPTTRCAVGTTVLALAVVGLPAAAAGATPPTEPFVSEIHYDNDGTDAGEFVEVHLPPGTASAGWSLTLYNGSGGLMYDTDRLPEVTAGDAPVVAVVDYPTNGIQNGPNDGIALVRPDGTVSEFLSYEGTLTATDGPAAGMLSTDIGVSQSSSGATGQSLSRAYDAAADALVWSAPAAATKGAVNVAGETPDPVAGACDTAPTHRIGDVQGSGPESPLTGEVVTVRGVVVGDLPGLSGFHLQDDPTDADGDLGTSDGVFVVSPLPVDLGDTVAVTGTVAERFGQTQIGAGAAEVCAEGGVADLPAPAVLDLPAGEGARESLEGMLVQPADALTVSEVFALTRFGELTLSEDGALVQPTELARPGPEAEAIAAENELRAIVLDDGLTTRLDATTAPYLSPTTPVRVGDVLELTAPLVLGYGFDQWRLQPADGTADGTVAPMNTRPVAPDAVGGDVQVAAFNVLNYFLTIEESLGGRGARSPEQLERQAGKIVPAILALDADVVAVQEIEDTDSTGYTPGDADAALADLVARLNAAADGETWRYVPLPDELYAVDRDVIRNAIIYRHDVVRAVGRPSAPVEETVWFNAREPIAQTFTYRGDAFTVVSNHFKSKSPGEPEGDNVDMNDGQGAWNGDRTRQAAALAAFVEGLGQGPGDEDVLLMGDFNAYSQEDPIEVLRSEGYTDLGTGLDPGRYSYVFGARSGSLDHALASASLVPKVTGAAHWNINAVESFAYQYTGDPELYAPDPYRSSDHDPLVLGLDLADRGPVTLQILGFNDFHGRLEPNDRGREAGAAVLAGAVAELRAENPNTVLVSAGDNIGASTFTSFSQLDEPTVAALNAAGLDVSAVGNHEFDRGFADLTDRVVPLTDFPYLGANVYLRGTDTPALEEFHVMTVDGVRVGFIGVVTESTATLVSPSGIEAIRFGDALEATNRVAATLQDGDEANGEADVVVLLAHEGADATTCEAIATEDSAFGELVRGASADVDAIFTGHTHRAYACELPVGDDGRTRPVIQAGQYGVALGRATLTVNPVNGVVTSSAADLLPMYTEPPVTTPPTPSVPAYAPDPEVAAIVAEAVAQAKVVGSVPVGRISADITRAMTPEGEDDRGAESSLGNLVADIQLWATSNENFAGEPAQIAFMNPGGLRADLLFTGDGTVTFREVADTQPFANTLVTMDLTGAQIRSVLEEQWQPEGSSRPKLHLGVSEGFSYTYLPDAPRGEHITSITLNGSPVDPDETFRVVVNSFLASGGDNFTTFTEGTDRADSGQIDLSATVEYFRAHPVVSPPAVGRATIGAGEQEEPELTLVYVYEKVDPLRPPSWSNSGRQTLVRVTTGHTAWPRELSPEELPEEVCGDGWAVQVDRTVDLAREDVPAFIDRRTWTNVLGWGTVVKAARHHNLGHLVDVPECEPGDGS